MANPQPTDRDRENARIRREIAQRQAEEYDRVLAWAEEAFGPGWRPSHRHYLVEIDEEECVRYTPERPNAAAIVYTVKNAAGEQRHFTVSEDGNVTECESYQAGFGPMLREPHSSKGFEQRGTFCYYYRYSLCWSPYERYQPKSAEQLATLRASRQRKRTEREDRKWAANHPLLAWAEAAQREDEAEEQRGRSV